MSDKPDKNESLQADATDPAAPADPAAPDATASADAPGQESADPGAARAARLAQIEQELVQADKDQAAVAARILALRRERDDLNRQGIGPAISQAEALKRMVESDQAQRIKRAETAALVTGIVGGKMPTVRTPAEQAAAQKKRQVVVQPIRKPE